MAITELSLSKLIELDANKRLARTGVTTKFSETIATITSNLDNVTGQPVTEDNGLDISNPKILLIMLEARIKTNAATAPGTTKKLILYYAFCYKKLSMVNAIEQLDNVKHTLVCYLVNTANKTRYYNTGIDVPDNKILYVWYDVDDVDAALAELQVNITII